MFGFLSFGMIVVIALTVILNIIIARSKSREFNYDAVVEAERRANAARRRDIDPELFITPDIDALPFKEYGQKPEYEPVRFAAAEAKEMSALPMIKTAKDMTNNDIKLKFGVANLEDVAIMEENYNYFIAAMLKWAEELIALREYADAETVLKETVRIGSDFSKSYTLLADVYAAVNDRTALCALYDAASADNFFPDDVQLKNKVVQYAADLLDTADGEMYNDGGAPGGDAQ